MKALIRQLSGMIAALIVLALGMAVVESSVAALDYRDTTAIVTNAALAVHETPIAHQTLAATAAPGIPMIADAEIFGLPQGFVIGVFVVTILVLGFMAAMLVIRARRRRRW